MKHDVTCPACGGQQWCVIQDVEIHRLEEIPDSSRRKYYQLRRRVLFEVWFPGETVVRLTSQYCTHCGFVLYKPRPTSQDIDAKYRFLQEVERDIGGDAETRVGRQRDDARARRTYAAIRRHVSAHPIRVLDFGGGNGKLLGPFLKRGHECELVDYSNVVRPGVKKIGDTLDQVPPDRKYHAIICSHVLEHVAEPDELVRQLSARLTEDGVIFAEVPLEMWGGMSKLKWDPVTHINYFNLNSFEELFCNQGLGILESQEAIGSYGKDRKEVLILLAGLGDIGRPAVERDGVALTLGRLQPTPMASLNRSLRHRQWPTANVIANCVRQSLPAPFRQRIKRTFKKFVG